MIDHALRVGFDLDGTISNFNEAYINLTIAVTGEDKFPPRPFDIPCWDYPQHYQYSEEQMAEVWRHIEADNCFWKRLSYYPEAKYTLNRLPEEGVDVYFITSRPGKTAKAQTEDWLDPVAYIPTVLISGEKGLCARALSLDMYIDDKPEFCADVMLQSPATKCYMLAQPWNAAILGVSRLPTLASFVDIILKEMQ